MKITLWNKQIKCEHMGISITLKFEISALVLTFKIFKTSNAQLGTYGHPVYI